MKSLKSAFLVLTLAFLSTEGVQGYHHPLDQQSRQGGDRGQLQPYADFAFQEELQPHQQQQQQQQLNQHPQLQFGTIPPGSVMDASSSSGGLPPCRTKSRVYLPDMQSFLIQVPLTYQEAGQACIACGSELVLIDGTNLDRFQEAFSSLGLYGDQLFWVKSWFEEQVDRPKTCPAVFVNSLMGNRLEPVQDNCQARLYALCY